MRPALAGLFTLALGATVLAGDGLVLVPHGHAFGEPADHPHGLALYRFPIALLGSPADAPTPADDRSSGPSFRLARSLGETLAGASLLIVIALVMVAAAPSRARAARVPIAASCLPAQWSALTPTRPPRTATLSSV